MKFFRRWYRLYQLELAQQKLYKAFIYTIRQQLEYYDKYKQFDKGIQKAIDLISEKYLEVQQERYGKELT